MQSKIYMKGRDAMAKNKTIPSKTTRVAVPPKRTGAKSTKSYPSTKKTSITSKQSSGSARQVKKTAKKLPRLSVDKPTVASATELLARAEAGIGMAVESLNNQMNAALGALTELACTQRQQGKAVVRTAPLDRATSLFQRLVADVVDEQLAEMLPSLITLRNEIAQANQDDSRSGLPSDFVLRAQETLDHVLTLAGVQIYEARIGDIFDPLIHLAVGESHTPDLPEGVVAEQLQPGFRSARGKVIVPAKVRINRK